VARGEGAGGILKLRGSPSLRSSRQLTKSGQPAPALRERLRGLGGFRDVLVHGYLRVDRARVAELLARAPADFSELASAVRAWFARTLG